MEVIVRNCQFENYLWFDGALCRPEDLPEVRLQYFVRGKPVHMIEEMNLLPTLHGPTIADELVRILLLWQSNPERHVSANGWLSTQNAFTA